MTNRPPAQEELEYLLGLSNFYQAPIRKFISSMDLPSLIGCLGYIAGMIEAQVPELVGTTAQVCNTTAKYIFPVLSKDAPDIKSGELLMCFPKFTQTVEKSGPESKLIQ